MRAGRMGDGPDRRDRSCGGCGRFRVPGGGAYGVCCLELARFCDDYVENMPKWTSVDSTISWVLDNLRHEDEDACERFEERVD